MKTIGLLGGMSWESTQTYYQLINQGIKQKLGGLHSAKIVLVSVDFAEIEKLQHQGRWQETAHILSNAAQDIEKAGADSLLICTNTMHKVADQIQRCIDIPIIHIADATAEVLRNQGINQIGLLGTSFTMEQDFYKQPMQEKFAIKVLTPNQSDRADVHRIIYQELCVGQLNPASKACYLKIIQTLSNQGAEAIVLACTEIGLLVKQADTDTLLVDTVVAHAEKAVSLALES